MRTIEVGLPCPRLSAGGPLSLRCEATPRLLQAPPLCDRRPTPSLSHGMRSELVPSPSMPAESGTGPSAHSLWRPGRQTQATRGWPCTFKKMFVPCRPTGAFLSLSAPCRGSQLWRSPEGPTSPISLSAGVLGCLKAHTQEGHCQLMLSAPLAPKAQMCTRYTWAIWDKQ